jgi:hypothetical protein
MVARTALLLLGLLSRTADAGTCAPYSHDCAACTSHYDDTGWLGATQCSYCSTSGTCSASSFASCSGSWASSRGSCPCDAGTGDDPTSFRGNGAACEGSQECGNYCRNRPGCQVSSSGYQGYTNTGIRGSRQCRCADAHGSDHLTSCSGGGHRRAEVNMDCMVSNR